MGNTKANNVRQATKTEIKAYIEIHNKLKNLDYSNVYDYQNVNHRLFFAAFDGTGNDTYKSASDIDSNPALLRDLSRNTDTTRNVYVEGVGTGGLIDKYVLGGPLGDGAKDKAITLYKVFQERVQFWHDENPEVDIHVSLTGFSRGAATARHFANLINELGVPIANTDTSQIVSTDSAHKTTFKNHTTYDGYLIPPGEIKIDGLLLFDTVATGQSSILNVSTPPTIKNTVHLTANDEFRDQFSLVSVKDPDYPDDPGILEFGLPGDHGDLGGGHDYGGLSSRSLQLGYEFLKNSGVPLDDLPSQYLPKGDGGIISNKDTVHGYDTIHDADRLYYTEFGERRVIYRGNPERNPDSIHYHEQSDSWTDAIEDQIEIDGQDRNENEPVSDLQFDQETLQLLRHYEEFEQKYGDQFLITGSGSESLTDISEAKSEMFSWYLQTIHSGLDPELVTLFSNQSGQNRESVADALMKAGNIQDALSALRHISRNEANGIDMDIADALRDVARGQAFSALGGSLEAVQALQRLCLSLESNNSSQTLAGVLDTILAINDRINLDTDIAEFDKGTLSGTNLESARAISNAFSLYHALEQGVDVDTVVAALELGNSIDNLIDTDGISLPGNHTQGELPDALVGRTAAALALYQAIDSGSEGDILIAGLQFTDQFFDNAASEAVSQTIFQSTADSNVPYVAYIRAGMQALDGDTGGAAVTVGTASLMEAAIATSNPYVIAFAVVVSIVAPSLMASSPKGALNFIDDGTGELGYQSGGELSDVLQQHAAGYLSYLNSLESRGFEFDTVELPGIEARGDGSGGIKIWFENQYAQPDSANVRRHLLTAEAFPDAKNPEQALHMANQENAQSFLDFIRANQTLNRIRAAYDQANIPGQSFSEQFNHAFNLAILHSDKFADLRASLKERGYIVSVGKNGIEYRVKNPLEGTTIIEAIAGTGVFAGGGQQMQPTVRVSTDQIRSTTTPRTLPVQELRRLGQTWGVDGNLFRGEQGNLLGMGLAAGLMSYNTLADTLVPTAEHSKFPENQANANAPPPLSPLTENNSEIATGTKSPDQYDLDSQIVHTNLYFSESFSSSLTPEVSYSDAQPTKTLTSTANEILISGELKPTLGTQNVIFPENLYPRSNINSQNTEAFIPVPIPLTIRGLAESNSSSGDKKIPSGSTNSTLFEPQQEPAALLEQSNSIVREPTFYILEDRVLFTRADELLADAVAGTTFLKLGASDHGTVQIDDNGIIEFLPDNNFTGLASFDYFQTTKNGNSESISVYIDVQGQNDAPIAIDDGIIIVSKNDVFDLQQLLANDRDVDGDPLGIVAVGQVTSGNMNVGENGTFIYDPEDSYVGNIDIVYVVADSNGRTSVATATLIYLSDLNSESTFAGDTLAFDDAEKHFQIEQGEQPEIVSFLTLPSTVETGVPLVSDETGLDSPSPLSNEGNSTEDLAITDVSGLDTNNETAISSGIEDFFSDGQEESVYVIRTTALAENYLNEERETFALRNIEVVNSECGTLEWNVESEQILFTPSTDFFGNAQLRYTLESFDAARQILGTATIAVANQDDTAMLTDRSYRTGLTHSFFNLNEDEQRIFTRDILLDTLRDVDNEELQIISLEMKDLSHGSVSLTESGDVRFIPAHDYVGEIEFELEVSDGHSIIPITVTPYIWEENDAPVVSDDSAVLLEDTNLLLSAGELLKNDIDPEDNHFSIVGVWATSMGDARYDSLSDTLHYTPEKNAFGTNWVDYLVEDAGGAWQVARLNLEISPTDDPIVAKEDFFVIREDQLTVLTQEQLLGNDENPDQEVLHIVSIDPGSLTSSQLTLNSDNSVLFQPDSDFSGIEHFSYTVADESGHRSTSSVTVQVLEVNDAPYVLLESASTLEDTAISFSNSHLLNNATDIENDPLRIVGARSQFGEVEFDEYSDLIHFTPQPNFNSTLYQKSALLEYLVQDDRGAETWASINIDVEAVDDLPQAFDDSLFAWSGGDGNFSNSIPQQLLLENDVDVDGEMIQVFTVSDSEHGSLVLQDGKIMYTADSDFSGSDHFNYTISDSVTSGAIPDVSTASVAITVLENHAPVSQDFATVAPEDTLLQFTLDDFEPFVYDIDFDQVEIPEQHRISNVSNAQNGTAELISDGTVVFTPAQDYNGVQHAETNGGLASFEYSIEDIVGNQTTSTAYITYVPINDNPVAVWDQISNGVIREEVPAVIPIADILGNDYDVDNDVVRFLGSSGASHGTVSVDSNNLVYRSGQNYHGQEVIYYQIGDDNGGSSTGQIRFNVKNVNDRPLVQYDAASGDDNGTNRYPINLLLSNDSDVDGDSLQISRITSVSGGSARIGGNYLNFDANSPGSASIRYMVSDGHGGETESRLSLNIAHVNLAPRNVHFALIENPNATRVNAIIRANDPDNPQSELRYTMSYATTGIIDSRSDGAVQYYGIVKQGHGSQLVSSEIKQGVMVVTVSDPEGASAQANLAYNYRLNTYNGGSDGGGKPVIFDLNHNGFNLLGAHNSNARFDWKGNGELSNSGWIEGEGDGILAFDHNKDGVIDQQSEISFTGYVENSNTDLEGLRAFDSNSDGRFAANDASWNQFGLWLDDGDGSYEEGELVGMDQLGITSLNLDSDEMPYEIDGNLVFGESDFTYTDGSTGLAADVAFEVGGGTMVSEPLPENELELKVDIETIAEIIDQQNSEYPEVIDTPLDEDEAVSSNNSDAIQVMEIDPVDKFNQGDIDSAVVTGIQTVAALPSEYLVTPVSEELDGIVPASVTIDEDLILAA